MTKRGHFGPLQLWGGEALVIGEWIVDELVAWHREGQFSEWWIYEPAPARWMPDEPPSDRLEWLLRSHFSALVHFATKLQKAALRPRRVSEKPIAVWTLTRVEAAAGYQFMHLRLLEHREDIDALPEHVLDVLYFNLLLLGDLFRYGGRPRRTYAESRALLKEREGLEAHEALERASGQAVRDARKRVEFCQRVERAVTARDYASDPINDVIGREEYGKFWAEFHLRMSDIHARTLRALDL